VTHIPGIQHREIPLLLRLNLIHSRQTDATPAIDIVVTDCLWLNNTVTVMMDPPLLFKDPLSTPTSHRVTFLEKKDYRSRRKDDVKRNLLGN
jgi:hypothetical protein